MYLRLRPHARGGLARGVYALTLEAINEEKSRTYEKWNFIRFLDDELLI